ncbi:MAG: Holliday junction resolvase RuvX [Candidatus Magasanikbacteria bacterium]
MNILGIDFGQKRVGLAWVQEGIDIVFPYGKIEEQDRKKAVEKIVDLVKKEHIDKIIIGLPLGLNGEENENTKRIRAFATELEGMVSAEIIFGDERFTSHQADNTLGDASRDEKSAMIILESYLEKQN